MSEASQDPHMRERFYRRERRSVPDAREFARAAVEAWGFASRADDVLVCVSELATNALLHGVPPGRGFLLCLRHAAGVLRVEVHDSGPGWPQAPDDDPDAENGRGLVLVAALADKWDVEVRDPGKYVWCEFTPGAGESVAPR